MEKQLFHREVQLGTASNFKTFLTVRQLCSPNNTVELKFETVFVDANDPQARQTKAQFFIDRSGLKNIKCALSVVAEHYERS
jgi:hypothetical protein